MMHAKLVDPSITRAAISDRASGKSSNDLKLLKLVRSHNKIDELLDNVKDVSNMGPNGVAKPQSQLDALYEQLFDVAMRIADCRAETKAGICAKLKVMSRWCGHSPDTPDDAIAASVCRDLAAKGWQLT
jgi:hypothetical protein